MSEDKTPLLADYVHEYQANFSARKQTIDVEKGLSRVASSLDSASSEKTLYGDIDEPWNAEQRLWITATPDPSRRRHRTLVLCFDGTGDQFDGDNSNVVQLMAMLRKDDNSRQLVYYQPGIGTYTDPLLRTPIASRVSRTLDMMLAWNLGAHVKDGYTFLMEHYTNGDKICIFGFSRGAYIARALAGMVHKVGLLPPCNHQQVPFAYDMYRREDVEGLKLSYMFKRTFSRHVNIEFLGVWDTVASVGIFPRYLPFVHRNSGIHHLRHALALDEHRVKFLPQFCVDTDFEAKKQLALAQKKAAKDPNRKKPKKEASAMKLYEDLINEKHAHKAKSDSLEVWFAGVHADVGGGSVKNEVLHEGDGCLARIPLRWMIRQCFECDTGIIFDAVQLQKVGLRLTMENGKPVLCKQLARFKGFGKPYKEPDTISLFRVFWNLFTSPFILLKSIFNYELETISLPNEDHFDTPTLVAQNEDHEAIEELKDAISDFNDQMDGSLMWRIFEWLPWRVKKQKAIIKKAEHGRAYTWMWNRGRGRKIPKSEMIEGMKVHRSVLTRLEASQGKYVPKVRPTLMFPDGTERKEQMMSYDEWIKNDYNFWEWVD